MSYNYLLVCLNMPMAILKIFTIFYIASPHLVKSDHNQTFVLQLITTIGIGLSAVYNIDQSFKVCCCPDKDKNKQRYIDSCVLFIVYSTPFVTTCWIANDMRKGNIVGDDYDICFWLVLTYFSSLVVFFLLTLVTCIIVLTNEPVKKPVNESYHHRIHEVL